MVDIETLRQRIVEAFEAGEDTTELERELIEARAAEQAKSELCQLAELATKRKIIKGKAEKAKANAQSQGEAIGRFLAERDIVVKGLDPILEKVKGLIALQDECFSKFHNSAVITVALKELTGFLPGDFTIPLLEMSGGQADAHHAAVQALWYLTSGLGILKALERVERGNDGLRP